MGIFKPKTKEQVETADTKRTVEGILKDPKTIQIGSNSAKEIQAKLKNWFTIDDLITKTSFKDLPAAIEMMNLLCLLEMCYREEKGSGVIKYKITLTKEIRLGLLYEERVEAEEKLAYIDRLIEKTTKELSQ